MMKDRVIPASKHSRTLFVIAALASTAIGLVIQDEIHQRRAATKNKEFQGLVGGLGLGPAIDLSDCAYTFDPRFCPACQENSGPIPAGAQFCPRHGFSIFHYPALERRGLPEGQGEPGS